MSPLHPPQGLSATAEALRLPKDAAVLPAPQTSEPLAAAPGAGSAVVSAAFSLRKTPPRAGSLGTKQRLGSGICLQVLCPPQSKPLPSLSLSIPSAVPGCEGWPGGWDPLPALSQGGKPPAQRCHRPCGIQQAPLLRDGERLSRALPPRTERRDFGARKAVADPPPSRPSPPPAHPSGRQECVVCTARLLPPNFSSSPRSRDHPDLRNAQCQEKEPPAPGRCRGNRDTGAT